MNPAQNPNPNSSGSPGTALNPGSYVGAQNAPPVAMPTQQPVTFSGGRMSSAGKAPPVAKANSNSSQNFLEIAEIRDGIVIMKDGSFRSVIMAQSINFDLMSPQEQEAIEYSYQSLLNSLYFPIQIFMRTERVDLQPYIKKLDKIRTEHDNMLLSLLMEDYIDYIDNLASRSNIMDKKFYITVPFSEMENKKDNSIDQNKTFFIGVANLFSNKQKRVVINELTLEKAKTELRNRVQSVMSGLQQCSIRALPLDTQELIELYYDTYNPDTATHQALKNYNSLTGSAIITKGEGQAPRPHLKQELIN